jgi:hypothetical protein
MSRAWILAVCFLAATGSARGNSLDLGINDNTVRVAGAFTPTVDLEVQASWLHNQDRGDVASIGLFQVGFASSGNQPIEAGLGAKAVFTDADNNVGAGSGSSVALGAFGRWVIPGADRVAVGGELYLAPGVLSFSDQDGYREANVYVSYDVLKTTWIYLGYRYVKANFDNRPNVTFDDQFNVGFRMNF